MKSTVIVLAPLVLAVMSCGGAGTDPLALSRNSILLAQPEVYEIDATTGDRIRTLPIYSRRIAASRNRVWIAYESDGGRLYNVVTGSDSPIAGTNSVDGIAFLDNGKISFWRSLPEPWTRVLTTMNPNGTDKVEHYSQYFNSFSRGLMSPNGKYVLHINGSGESTASAFELELRTSSSVKVRTLRDSSLGDIDAEPSWSPDSKRIAFVAYPSVYEIDVETGVTKEIVRFTETPYHRISFIVDDHWFTRIVSSRTTWSPDGKFVIFNADYNRRMVAFKVNVKSGNIEAFAPFRIYPQFVFWGS